MKSIGLLVNPISGGDYPILSIFQKAMEKYNLDWEAYVVTPRWSIQQLTEQAIQAGHDLIAIYGGDGTVSEVITQTPLNHPPYLILPGGTANVLANDLNLSPSPEQILEHLMELQEVTYDTYLCNDTRRFLRINFGSFAQHVLDADRDLKRNLGRAAYLAAYFKPSQKKEPRTYKLTIDGEMRQIKATGIMIANIGTLSNPNITLHPDISPTDGKLDIIAVPNSDWLEVAQVATASIFSSSLPDVQHFQAEKIEVLCPQNEDIIIDDIPQHINQVTIQIEPQFLKLLTNKSSNANSSNNYQ